MSKTNNDAAAPGQKANYLQEALATYDALGKAISLLQARSFGFADLAETNIINAEVPELQAKQRKVRAEMNAFLYQGTAIEPPTGADFAKVKALSQQLDSMKANSDQATVILQAVTSILNAWSQTH